MFAMNSTTLLALILGLLFVSGCAVTNEVPDQLVYPRVLTGAEIENEISGRVLLGPENAAAFDLTGERYEYDIDNLVAGKYVVTERNKWHIFEDKLCWTSGTDACMYTVINEIDGKKRIALSTEKTIGNNLFYMFGIGRENVTNYLQKNTNEDLVLHFDGLVD